MPHYYTLDLGPGFMEELRETLATMIKPVRIEVFVGPGCETCEDTLKLVKAFEEVAPSAGGRKLIEVIVYDKSNPEHLGVFREKGVDRVPTIGVIDARIIRYTGIPAEEEIRGFVETIMRISEDDSGLEEETKRILATLKSKVHIETIVTPQCPYCPYAALLSNMFAFEAWKQGNPVVLSDTIEAYENPDIADKYGVMSVPAIALNGRLVFVGVPYEEDFIHYVRAAAENRLDDLIMRDFGGATQF